MKTCCYCCLQVPEGDLSQAASLEPGVVRNIAAQLKSLPISFPVQSVAASPHQAKFLIGEVEGAQASKVRSDWLLVAAVYSVLGPAARPAEAEHARKAAVHYGRHLLPKAPDESPARARAAGGEAQAAAAPGVGLVD